MKKIMTNMFATKAHCLTILTLLLASSTLPAQADWFVEAGPFYRGQMKISVDGGSRAHDSGTLAAAPGTRGGSAIGPVMLANDDGTAAVFRQFDNGYVGPSGWVWAQNAGITQHFAYETPGQYNAAADTLTFTRSQTLTGGSSTRTSTRVTDSGPSGWDDSTRTNGTGILVTLGYYLCGRADEADLEARENENHNEWSLLFRFGWLDGMDANFRNRSAYRQDVNTTRVTSSITGTSVQEYTYDTLGNPFFPAAPYAMNDPGGVGPMISDTPDSITTLSQTETPTQSITGRSGYQAQSLVDLDLDVQAFTFQAGPRWSWGPDRGLSLFLQPLATLNLIEATANRTEYFRSSNGRTLASWNDRADDSSWRWGGGLHMGLKLDVSENWYLNGAGGYEWVKSTHLNVGPDRIRIDLSGYQIELALGRSF